jgi:hypothetical protein
MRYVIFVIDHPNNHGNADEMKAIDTFNEKLRSNGHWILAAGIGDPSTATVLDNRTQRTDQTERTEKGEVRKGSLFDGHPHHNEYYSGFWIIETPSHEVALALASEGSKACNRKVELRPFLGNS